MSYLEDAAAELDKVRDANDARADRARALRKNGEDTLADAVAAETSFRLAAGYTALAALGRDAAPDPEEDTGA